jgi:hypothetical protein
MTIPYADQHEQRTRAVQVLSLGDDAVVAVRPKEWRVRSSSGHGFYRVRRSPKGWDCECPSAANLYPANCKHAWAVRLFLRPVEYATVGKTLPTVPSRPGRLWPEYDAAQQAEHPEFDDYLWDLLRQIDEPTRSASQPGRPPIPLRLQAFHTIKKVHFGQSSRRARGLLEQTSSGVEGSIARVPNYTVPSRFLNRPDACEVLLRLVEFSALPMRELENGGTVGVDSTGFSTSARGNYATEKYDPGRKHEWVKGHLVGGLRTHAVLSVAVTDGRVADCPQFVPLIKRVVALGFAPSAAVADKAYSTREIYNELDRLGIDAWIPFRKGTTGTSRGSPLYHRKWLEFQLHRAAYDAKYHVRSNIESTNWGVKSRLREALLSKNPQARFAEVLAKIVAYNIGQLIYWSRAEGIDRTSVGLTPPERQRLDLVGATTPDSGVAVGAELGPPA